MKEEEKESPGIAFLCKATITVTPFTKPQEVRCTLLRGHSGMHQGFSEDDTWEWGISS